MLVVEMARSVDGGKMFLLFRCFLIKVNTVASSNSSSMSTYKTNLQSSIPSLPGRHALRSVWPRSRQTTALSQKRGRCADAIAPSMIPQQSAFGLP